MKKFLFYLLAALLAIVGCTKNNDPETLEEGEEDVADFLQQVFWEKNDDVYYNLTSEDLVTPEEMVESVFGGRNDLDENDLKIKEDFLKRCEEKQKELNEDDPDGAPALLFDRICYTYKTIDQKGDEIELSAFAGWAVIVIVGYVKPYAQNHILLCCPYTHTKENECATASHGGKEFMAMWTDNLFIMPDGQGFGVNKNNVQTYLNHNLHAQQYYDALLAGKKLYLEEKKGKLEKDWTLRVLGASQGAGDAIAVHKYLDTRYDRLDLTEHYKNGNKKLANELCKQYGYPAGTKIIEAPLRDDNRFEYSYVCCGPYCPEVTMQTYSGWGSMSYPCVIPLVIKSMLACYPDFLVGEKYYSERDFFSKEWNEHSGEFDNIYLKKTMDSEALNKYICKTLDINPTARLDKILSHDMCDPNSQIYQDLMTCLKKQDLTRGWTPRTKTKLLFTKNDEVVPYANTEKLIAFFYSNKCTLKEVEYSWIDKALDLKVHHVFCCGYYIARSWDW